MCRRRPSLRRADRGVVGLRWACIGVRNMGKGRNRRPAQRALGVLIDLLSEMSIGSRRVVGFRGSDP